jgi:septal ring factor EnvC (AmiA/AmiB activator)
MPSKNSKKRARESAGSANNSIDNVMKDVLEATDQTQTDRIVAAFVTALTKFGDVMKKMDETLGTITERLESVEAELLDVKNEPDKLATENKQLNHANANVVPTTSS